MLYLYKIYHIPSAYWFLTLSKTKYSTVQKVPKQMLTCLHGEFGNVARNANMVKLDSAGSFDYNLFCSHIHACRQCILYSCTARIPVHEVFVYRSEYTYLNKVNTNGILTICSQLATGDARCSDWIELPYE